jgi:putative membrane protein
MIEISPFRDQLAVQRTRLANERTLLAYVRTSIALVAAGATAIHVFDTTLLDAAGWALSAMAAATLAYGVSRFLRVRGLLRSNPSPGGDRPAA